MPKKMMDKRSFKVSMSSFAVVGGRYISSTPSSAAKKAARVLFRQADSEPTPAGGKQMMVSFELRETTRGSKDTVFAYKAVREKRTTPTNFIVNGKPFTIKRSYNITVTAVTEQTMMRSVTRGSNLRDAAASPARSVRAHVQASPKIQANFQAQADLQAFSKSRVVKSQANQQQSGQRI